MFQIFLLISKYLSRGSYTEGRFFLHILRLFFNEERARRIFRFIVPFGIFLSQFLIILSSVIVVLDSLPNLDPRYHKFFIIVEIAITLIFTLEYFYEIVIRSSVQRRRFIFSFFGVVDLLAILPFYISYFNFGEAYTTTLAIRILRTVRLLKFLEHYRAVRLFSRAFIEARQEIFIFSFCAIILIYLASVGIYIFEHKIQAEAFSSIAQSLWWAVISLTTVGYGDIVPVTAGGKIFTCFILLLGLGFVAIPTSIFTTVLLQIKRDQVHEVDMHESQVEKAKKAQEEGRGENQKGYLEGMGVKDGNLIIQLLRSQEKALVNLQKEIQSLKKNTRMD